MSLIDYSIFYKRKYSDLNKFSSENVWDLFISALNDSERVKLLFKTINSRVKHWLVFPDYEYKVEDLPDSDHVFTFNFGDTESNMIVSYFENHINPISNKRICVDITGFLRPQLIFLVRYLYDLGIEKVDFVYSDPISYTQKEKTIFTVDPVYQVRQIQGCEGIHNPDTSNDLLIIGAGYDHKLITSVAEDKEHSSKIQIFGFPSLQPDMYQENILRAYKAEEAVGGRIFEDHSSLFAPADDPFITAKVIQECVNKNNKMKKITNLYLCPLSTKAQTLGFSLYYVFECINTPTSIIFPFCSKYTRETSYGISKVWKYTIEFR